jgi:hypothetical protein
MSSVRANLPWSIYVLSGTVFFGIVMSITFSNGLVAPLHETLLDSDS